MKRTISCFVLLALITLLSAWDQDVWSGEWLDEEIGIAYRIELVNNLPNVMRAIDKRTDTDKQVVHTQFKDNTLTWTAYIAGVDLLISYSAVAPDSGRMKVSWSSGESSGERELHLSGWDGAWLDSENGVTSVIRYYLGAYVVSEVFGSDDVNYSILNYSLDNGVLTWTAKLARRSTLTYLALSRDIDALHCYWLNNKGESCERTLHLLP